MDCPNSTLQNTTTRPESPENEVLSSISKAIMDFAVPTVCVIGLLGNLLNMLVLSREKMQRNLSKMEKSAHYGMIALAFSDFMFCLLALLFTLVPRYKCYKSRSILLYVHFLLSPSITIFIIASTMMIVYMAAERYLAVCHPFKARRIISLRRTRIIITMVFVCCALATTPLFMERRIEVEDYEGQEFYKVNKHFDEGVIVIRRLCWSVLFDLVPCGLLIYFNTCLIYSIKKAKKLRMNMAPLNDERRGTINRNSSYSSHRHKPKSHSGCTSTVGGIGNASTTELSLRPENNSIFRDDKLIRGAEIEVHLRTEGRSMRSQSVTHRRRHTDTALNSVTATLVSIVVMFLVLVSPSEILKFSFHLASVDSVLSDVIRDITNFMQALNFSANFILYCVMNKYFRETLAAMFCFYTNGHASLSKKSEYPTISLRGSPSSS
ncbi:pyrokinin-1 receptor [Octopus vulgaris]|uniref:Pyrokinin-1 receptor n=1 Tax=Octopus vulgaris TaxID=6645 RepID=A0AA36AGA7_OCTVU|nr:pyrokinin-1 receptor [Octopus vulgaris]